MIDDGYTVPPMTARVRDAARTLGVRPVAGHLARWGGQTPAGLPWTLAGSRGRFQLQGQSYPYLYHRYKRSWLSERAVEVPVAQELVRRHAGARVLEVGNVLSHYGPHDHTVLDKYEHAPGVLNRDVLELDGLGPFDLIVPGGRLFLTVPAGYNPSFDAALAAGELPLSQTGALRPTGPGASWSEVAPDEVWSAPYDFLLYRANGVLLAFIER